MLGMDISNLQIHPKKFALADNSFKNWMNQTFDVEVTII